MMLSISLFIENMLQGAMIVLGIQLTLVSFFSFSDKKIRNKLLGVYTIINAFLYFYTVFMAKINTIPLLRFLFVGPNEILDAILLYLYILLLSNSKKPIIKHFIFPVLYLLLYKILNLFFKDIYDANIQSLGVIHYFLAPFYFSFYFYLGHKIFKQDLNDALKIKARKKFKYFFYSVNIKNILCSVLIFIPITMMFLGADFDNDDIENLFNYLGKWYNIFGLIINQFLILYVLSESKKFKSLFLTANIFEDNKVEIENQSISDKINFLFEDSKAFLDPNFNVHVAANEIEVSSKIISAYILNAKGVSVKEYLSKLRIEEFKGLLLKDKEVKYDLFGIASKAGFKSKASFYRAFKKYEGITPGEFRQKIKRNSIK